MADNRPHPPVQAKYAGRRNPAPHRDPQAVHDRTMQRPNEQLHLACHGLAGHRHHHKKDDAPEGES